MEVHVADVPETVVVILSGLTTEFFPNPVQLVRGSLVKWHCNPIPGQGGDPQPFKVEFSDPNPFGVDCLKGMVGSTTPAVAVVVDAPLQKYPYKITIGNRIFDPEIIIEEAVPEPLKTKHA
jgi:hypothetical protein